MKNVNVNKLPLLELWYDNDKKKKWSSNLPFSPHFPLWAGIDTKESSVVYFELAPGNELGEHSESSEEILFMISGEAEMVVDGKGMEISTGELVVVPAGIVHYVINKGKDTAKFIGFYASPENHSSFSEEVSPVGMKVL